MHMHMYIYVFTYTYLLQMKGRYHNTPVLCLAIVVVFAGS